MQFDGIFIVVKVRDKFNRNGKRIKTLINSTFFERDGNAQCQRHIVSDTTLMRYKDGGIVIK